MDSASQIISYLSRVSKNPIYVNGKLFSEDTVIGVKLSNRFFVKDDCIMCGKCCANYNVCYTKSHFESILFATDVEFQAKGIDYSRKLELIAGVKPKTVNINGADCTLYSFPKTGKKNHNIIHYDDRTNTKYCHFLQPLNDGRHGCGIHPIRSVTCKIPHMRFIYRANTQMTCIAVGAYPRNFNIHCPIQYKIELHEPSVQTRIADLKLLLQCAKDLNIDTFLPEVIEYLENGGRKPREFTIKASRRKLFGAHKD